MTTTPEEMEVLPADIGEGGSFSAPGGSIDAPKSSTKPKLQVIVDDTHPFDVDAYISGYTGKVLIFT